MKAIILIALIIAALVGAGFIWPVSDWMQDLILWVKSGGLWGVVIYAVIYIVAIVLLIPGSLLTLGAGFIYGPFWGTLLVSPASVIGAFIAFSLARGRLRPWVTGRLAGKARFRTIDKAVGEQGFKIVTLLRLSPVFPFTLLNYALGLTGVTARSYVLASFLGMLPATFLYTYLGSLVPTVSGLGHSPKSDAQTIFMWVGFGVTLVVTAYVTRLARRALQTTIAEEETL